MARKHEQSFRQKLREEGMELARGQLTTMGLTIALPPLVAAMTLIFGIIQWLPMPYLLAATALTFGGVASGMHHFSQLFFQRTSEGKLRVSSNNIGKRYNGLKLVAVKYSFTYQNLAVFPLEFEVRPLHISLGASVNPKPERPITGTKVPLGATGIWYEAEVPITREMKGEVVEGQFDVEIIYGRVGNKRHTMIKRFKPSIKFKPNGDIDVAEVTELE